LVTPDLLRERFRNENRSQKCPSTLRSGEFGAL
jgi:hypothetical protein